MYNFIKLNADSNQNLRILTQPYQYYSHFVGGKKMCTAMTGDCALCKTGDKPRPRWILGVCNNQNQTFNLLDIGYSVFIQFRDLAKNIEWGDPRGFDVEIIPAGTGTIGLTHKITPLDKSPLSEQQEVMSKSINIKYIESLCKPFNAEPAPAPEPIPTLVDAIPDILPVPKPIKSRRHASARNMESGIAPKSNKIIFIL